MEASVKTLGAAQFKAECLSLMDEVRLKHTRITITKRGKPVAQLVPIEDPVDKDPLAFYYIGGEILGDVTSPLVSPEDYEALR